MVSFLLANSQLFGEADPDQDVSPDTEDPEAAGKYKLFFLFGYTIDDILISIK